MIEIWRGQELFTRNAKVPSYVVDLLLWPKRLNFDLELVSVKKKISNWLVWMVHFWALPSWKWGIMFIMISWSGISPNDTGKWCTIIIQSFSKNQLAREDHWAWVLLLPQLPSPLLNWCENWGNYNIDIIPSRHTKGE